MLQTILTEDKRQAVFEGEHVVIWPYVRGYFPRTTLFDLWHLIEEAGDWQPFFWNETVYPNTPVSQMGDPTDWLSFIEDHRDPKAVLIVQAKSNNEIAGLIWFNHQEPTRAFGSIWMRPKYRGIASREAVNLGLEYAFYARGWQEIWATTPFPVARNLIVKCGFREIAWIPGFATVGQNPASIYILRIKESEYGRR